MREIDRSRELHTITVTVQTALIETSALDTTTRTIEPNRNRNFPPNLLSATNRRTPSIHAVSIPMSNPRPHATPCRNLLKDDLPFYTIVDMAPAF